MKSKVLFGLFAALLILTLAPSSFAQVNISISNAPSDAEVQSSHHAQTTDPESPGAGIVVSGTLVAPSPLTTTYLTLSFPAAITSGVTENTNGGTDIDVPNSGDAIRIEGQTGLFATVTGIYTVDYEDGTLTIALPTATANTQSGSFSVVGVRIDATELTAASAPFEVEATLSTAAGGYQMLDNDANIITSLTPGFTMAPGARSGQTSSGTIVIFANRTVPDSTASFVITEGSVSAFRTESQHSTGGGTGGINPTRIRLTFAGVPSGVTLTLSESTTATLDVSLDDTSINSTDLVATLEVDASELDDVEQIQVNVTASASTSSSTPFPGGDITVTATLIPIGEGLDEDGLPDGTGGIPRYDQVDVTTTIGSIVAANTTLLVPYAVVDNSILYDTGIALANTSLDPLESGSAVPTAGAITFTAFPNNAAGNGPGASFSFTTSAAERPGRGLSTDGTLAPGATWVVLLSTILAQEGVASPFTGYLFLEASFLNAHGIVFVSDFGSGPFPFTSFSPMLVLPAPSSAGRGGGALAAESLGF